MAPAPPTLPLALDLEQLREPLGLDRSTELSAELIQGGRSNITVALRAGERDLILRRPPLGPALPTAHNMKREYTVLRALADSDVPVPRPLFLCEDPSLIGAPFYLMERVDGRVIRGVADFDLEPAEAARCAEALIETLVHIHALPYTELGLGELGRPAGFMARQLTRWREQLARGAARSLPDLTELGRRLGSRLPESPPATLVHGDFRIDNVALHPDDPGRIVAVFDWEMATLGDPLADVGMLLVNWGEPGEEFVSDVQAVMAEPGFPTRAEAVERYARLSGRDLSQLGFYVAFAHFKLAVIAEGIHARHLAGETVGDGFEMIETIGPALAAHGLELVA